MAALTTLNTLTLGNTFGGWYARTNEMIQRLNLLKTASITGGDGILVKENSALGGFTAEISDTIAKNVTFQGNLTVLGSLNAAFTQDVSGINVILPYNSGVTLGNIVYLDSSGLLQKAKADDECTAEVVGVVIGFTGGQAQVATSGKISGSSVIGNFLGSAGATLQKGVVYFLSEGVTGAGTTLEPSVVDYVSKPVLLGLTGDTGLILPYRGFIATYGLSGGSSTTVYGASGAVAGVLSVNGITAAIYNDYIDSGTLRKEGHIHAVNSIVFGNYPEDDDRIPIVGPVIFWSNSDYSRGGEQPTTNSIYGGITSAYGALSKITHQTLGSKTTHIERYFKDKSCWGHLYTTSGLSGDIYRLHKLKITNTGLESFTVGKGINFTINRSISISSGTYDGINTGFYPDSAYQFPAYGTRQSSAVILEYRSKEYQIYGPDVAGPGVPNELYHPSGPFTANLLTVLTRPFPCGHDPAAINHGATCSTFNGTPDSSGTYPYIPHYSTYAYPYYYSTKTAAAHIWQFNSVELNGDPIERYIANGLRGTWYGWGAGSGSLPFPTGLTLSSNIIGWVPGLTLENGAISENINIAFPAIFQALQNSLIQYDNGIWPISLNVELELYKYNPFTATDGALIVINKTMVFDTVVNTTIGRSGNIIGYS